MISVDGFDSLSGCCREWSTMLILTRARLWLNDALSLARDPGGMSSHEVGLISTPSAPQSRRSPALICASFVFVNTRCSFVRPFVHSFVSGGRQAGRGGEESMSKERETGYYCTKGEAVTVRRQHRTKTKRSSGNNNINNRKRRRRIRGRGRKTSETESRGRQGS